jgi:flavin-dependent thymidylate synthase
MDTKPTGNKHMNSVLEQLRWKKFPVGSDGFICLVDLMGDDRSVVQAAAVSYGADTRRCDQCNGAGTIADMVICETCGGKGNVNQKSDAAVRKLIRYLMKQRHTSPFEQVELKFLVRVPMDCWRQWIRHRMANVNEYSTRYQEAIDAMSTTDPTGWRVQATDNKQGSGVGEPQWPSGRGPLDGLETCTKPGEYLSNIERELQETSRRVYTERLAFGVAREQARKDLPLSTYCYDASTYVLTSRGFVQWPDVLQSDKLGTWDSVAGTLTYEQPEYLTVDDYDGQMYSVQHRGVDLLVTPHHKMYVDTGKGYNLVRADELKHRCLVRYCKTAPQTTWPMWSSEHFTTHDQQALLSLFGFFIGDGHSPLSGAANTLVFSLVRPRKIQYLLDLCSRLGWPCEKCGPHYVVRYPEITNSFRELFYDSSKEKQIPDMLLKLNSSDALAFMQGLQHSDGCKKAGGAWRFDTTSKQVAEQALVIGIHAGLAANEEKPTVREGNSKTVHHVYFFSNRTKNPVINQMTRNTSMAQYTGKVYCAKTRTGILVVKRNGKVCLSGNTEAYWKIDLHNLFHFLGLRMDRHAQLEIRQYADIIGNEIVKPLLPHCWEAFEDYRLNGIVLSGPERKLLGQLLDSITQAEVDRLIARTATEITAGTHTKMTPRDLADFASKLLPLPE